MEVTAEERTATRHACTRWLSQGAKPHNMADELAQIAAHAPAQADATRYGGNAYCQAFEAEVAALLGKPAAVFMPSGSMAQPIALRIWSEERGTPRVAFHPTCHLELHEHRAYSELHGLRATLVGPAHRLMTLEDLQAISHPLAAVLIELPQREIGGQLPSWEDLVALTTWAREQGIRLHLDGARLWECSPFYERPVADIAALFDSVYVSFYKTLAGIAGAVLAGPKSFIDEAKIWQRRHGGNLVYQYPFIVSARVGMEAHLPEVPSYVERAGRVAKTLGQIPGIHVKPEAPPTHMMHLYFRGSKDALERAALEVGAQSGVWLVGSLRPTDAPETWKIELSIGRSALAITDTELANLFGDIMKRAASA